MPNSGIFTIAGLHASDRVHIGGFRVGDTRTLERVLANVADVRTVKLATFTVREPGVGTALLTKQIEPVASPTQGQLVGTGGNGSTALFYISTADTELMVSADGRETPTYDWDIQVQYDNDALDTEVSGTIAAQPQITTAGVVSLAEIPTLGLVNDWDPDVGYGGGQITDDVGAAHAVFGAGGAAPTWATQGDGSKLVVFAGAQHADAGALALGAAESMVAVVRLDASSVYHVVGRGSNLGTGRCLRALTSGHSAVRNLVSAGTGRTAASILGELHTVALRDDGQGVEAYLDGVLTGYQKNADAVVEPAGNFFFGRDPRTDILLLYLVGAIGRVVRHSRALTDAEIRKAHRKLRVKYTTLPSV